MSMSATDIENLCHQVKMTIQFAKQFCQVLIFLGYKQLEKNFVNAFIKLKKYESDFYLNSILGSFNLFNI